MVEGIPGKDMFYAEAEVKVKILHGFARANKINQSFGFRKLFFSMAGYLGKWLMIWVVGWMHPFFVSVSEVQHNAADKSLEISIKVFIDDFEKALGNGAGFAVDLSHPADSIKTNQLVFQYLQKHFLVKVNGQPVKLQYVGYEKEREAAWCYVQVSSVPVVNTIDIDNSLLYDAFDKQINIMHVVVNGRRKSTKVGYPESRVSFSF